MIRTIIACIVVAAAVVAGLKATDEPDVHVATPLHSLPAAATAAAWKQVSATPASAVYDSIGVNVHLNYPEYTKRYDAFKSLLSESGIRHIRTSVTYEDPQAAIGHVVDLGKSGIKADVVFDSRTSAEQLRAIIKQGRPALEIVEGTNEYDLTNRPDWSEHVIEYQKSLYKEAHALALPVIGPAMTSSNAYEKVGNLEPYLDYGNMHNYFSGFNPGTAGWGGAFHGDLYGSLAYNIRVAKIVSGTKPVMSTETGYCTMDNTRNAVTPGIAARYLPRLYLEQWLAHVPRTYVYEFISEGQPGCDSHLGLVTPALQIKPGYTAVQTLTRELTPTGAVTAPAHIGMRLEGDLHDVRRLLVQTAPHTLKLFIWNETPSWNVNDGLGKPIAVPERTVRLTLQAPWKAVRKGVFADTGKQQTQTMAGTQGVALQIADRLSVIELRDN